MTTPGDEGRTELAWREIVEHYGERPVLHDDEAAETREPATAPDGIEDVEELDDAEDREDEIPAVERFHPPAAPPFPVPRTWQRGVAWSGILVAPALALVIGLFSFYVHPLVGWGLVIWFVGGFLYLVREMPRAPRDPWDDGSRI
ncbi:hypothetical protein [Nocardioides sp.]|uniref:hypothetical protein n=1 Tax=Nocardioides sp. TaxID=35761 RepID=UPI002629D8E8|nr:hypothetical protein [Nocardioides sp.]MCW2736418.1 hypothetical protein [Nocardioides sp.]